MLVIEPSSHTAMDSLSAEMRMMRQASLLAGICFLLAGCSPSPAQTEIPRQGEYGAFTKWNKYTYDIASSYPYVKALPTPDKIPEIISLLHNADISIDVPGS